MSTAKSSVPNQLPGGRTLKVLRQGNAFVCGMCRKKYRDVNAAKACVVACYKDFIAKNPQYNPKNNAASKPRPQPVAAATRPPENPQERKSVLTASLQPTRPQAGPSASGAPSRPKEAEEQRKFRCGHCKSVFGSKEEARDCAARCKIKAEEASRNSDLGAILGEGEQFSFGATEEAPPPTPTKTMEFSSNQRKEEKKEKPKKKPREYQRRIQVPHWALKKCMKDAGVLVCRRCGTEYTSVKDVVKCFDIHPPPPPGQDPETPDRMKYRTVDNGFQCRYCNTTHEDRSDVIACYDSHEEERQAKKRARDERRRGGKRPDRKKRRKVRYDANGEPLPETYQLGESEDWNRDNDDYDLESDAYEDRDDYDFESDDYDDDDEYRMESEDRQREEAEQAKYESESAQGKDRSVRMESDGVHKNGDPSFTSGSGKYGKEEKGYEVNSNWSSRKDQDPTVSFESGEHSDRQSVTMTSQDAVEKKKNVTFSSEGSNTSVDDEGYVVDGAGWKVTRNKEGYAVTSDGTRLQHTEDGYMVDSEGNVYQEDGEGYRLNSGVKKSKEEYAVKSNWRSRPRDQDPTVSVVPSENRAEDSDGYSITSSGPASKASTKHGGIDKTGWFEDPDWKPQRKQSGKAEVQPGETLSSTLGDEDGRGFQLGQREHDDEHQAVARRSNESEEYRIESGTGERDGSYKIHSNRKEESSGYSLASGPVQKSKDGDGYSMVSEAADKNSGYSIQAGQSPKNDTSDPASEIYKMESDAVQKPEGYKMESTGITSNDPEYRIESGSGSGTRMDSEGGYSTSSDSKSTGDGSYSISSDSKSTNKNGYSIESDGNQKKAETWTATASNNQQGVRGQDNDDDGYRIESEDKSSGREGYEISSAGPGGKNHKEGYAIESGDGQPGEKDGYRIEGGDWSKKEESAYQIQSIGKDSKSDDGYSIQSVTGKKQEQENGYSIESESVNKKESGYSLESSGAPTRKEEGYSIVGHEEKRKVGDEYRMSIEEAQEKHSPKELQKEQSVAENSEKIEEEVKSDSLPEDVLFSDATNLREFGIKDVTGDWERRVPMEVEQLRRKEKAKFLRAGIKYQCRQCSSTYYTKHEVMDCYDGHFNKNSDQEVAEDDTKDDDKAS